MLTLTREVGQKILIGEDIVLTVVSVSSNGRVKLGIEAPKQVRIDRMEVLDRIRQENVDSANAIPSSDIASDIAAWASYGARRANARGVKPTES
ncbi:MAG TPA: carbon storage regulator [Candidatus Paceibacterota bacterium]|nr:carbon storage regulator [Candidatus Paceibacterota bacterium]